jgi:hypothetical protein
LAGNADKSLDGLLLALLLLPVLADPYDAGRHDIHPEERQEPWTPG